MSLKKISPQVHQQLIDNALFVTCHIVHGDTHCLIIFLRRILKVAKNMYGYEIFIHLQSLLFKWKQLK